MLLGFPGSSDSEESTCNAEDLGLIPGLGRSPGEGNSYPLQRSGLENSMDCLVHGGHKESGITEQISLHFTSCPVVIKNGNFNRLSQTYKNKVTKSYNVFR